MLPKSEESEDRAQSFGVKPIAVGLMTIVLLVIILNYFLTLDVVNNSSGPFSVDQVVSIGQAAIAIAVLAMLVLAASVALRYIDRF